MMTVVSISKAAPGWSPSPFQAPTARPKLAQAVVANPVSPTGGVVRIAPPPPSFIDSALVAAIFTGIGTVAYSTLTAGAYKANWKKSTIIFGALSALLGLATVGNLWEVRQR